MHIFFFSHNLLFPLLTFLILIFSQHSLAADPNNPADRPLLALNKAVSDFTLPLYDSSSSSSTNDQGALLSLAPDPGTNGLDGNSAPVAPAAAASLVSASNQCSSSDGNSRKAENKKRRRRRGTDTDTESGTSGTTSGGEGCGWDEGGKESGTDRETDYDIHIPDSYVDRSRHQFFYPAQLKEDPSTCSQPLSTPVCDDGSYMIAKPDPRAPPSLFHFTLPFCRPRTLIVFFFFSIKHPRPLVLLFIYFLVGGGGGQGRRGERVEDPIPPPKIDERERTVINGFFFLILQMNRVSLQMPMARKTMVLLSSST